MSGTGDVSNGFEFLGEPGPEESPPAPPPKRPRPMRAIALVGVIAVAVLVALAIALLRPPAEDSAESPPREPQSSETPRTDPVEKPAVEALAELDVKGRAPTTGYERERFGPEWADIDGNGCDTRNDVLQRDLVEVKVDATDPCIVESGTLLDPYSGDTIPFTRGTETSYDVHIDHVVALSNAWQTGAQYWKPRKRRAFANDPMNLLAVDGGLNLQKSDGDAATWLPPRKPYRCEFVARQIAVKARYALWLTQPEHDAMARILSDCPGQDLTL